jgi:hypothetical protein
MDNIFSLNQMPSNVVFTLHNQEEEEEEEGGGGGVFVVLTLGH